MRNGDDRSDRELGGLVRARGRRLWGGPRDFDEILERAGEARLVLIGEASHGTHDFYRVRAELTKRLVREKGFTAVAVEADWPDAYRVNQWVRGRGADTVAEEALRGFARFPQWMWRNADVLDFVGWLRERNDSRARGAAEVGFYGLDLYSLFSSMHVVLDYLDRVAPDAAAEARDRYACFDHVGESSEAYGYLAHLGVAHTCEDEVVAELVDMQLRASELSQRDGRLTEEDHFSALQNARLVKNAERYYREMYLGSAPSWNLRDTHMADTLEALALHLDRQSGAGKIVVWAHNSHLGDARATELGGAGELNLGQLVRERRGPGDCYLVGLTTHEGTVTAASRWGGVAERRLVRPALPGSFEAAFHEAGVPSFWLDLRDAELAQALAEERLERAIGVIYRPETERQSHYFRAALSRQFDAVLHLDSTRALEPLEREPSWITGEAPETFPSAL